MKKLLITLVIPLLLYGCSNELPQEEINATVSSSSKVITIDDAVAIALEQSKSFPQEVTSRQNTTRTADPKNVIVKKRLSRSGSEPSYYIVNFDNEQGYAVVPAFNIGEPIIGFVPEGNYSTEGNASLEAYLSMAEEYIAQQPKLSGDIGPFEPIPAYNPDTVIVDTNYYYHLDPRVPQEWGQDNIYGQFCPNGVTGCGPLAMATVTVWTRFKDGDIPTRLYYNYKDCDIPYEDITWSELFKHRWVASSKRDHLCYTNDPYNVHKSIARLCRQIGHEANTTYHYLPYPYSESYTDSTETILKKYVPSSYTVTSFTSYDYEHVNYYLDHGLLLLLAADSYTNQGHTWIGDGYHISSISYKIIRNYKDPKTMYTERRTDKSCTIHMRWGYDGDGDGYFSGNVFDLKTSFGSYKYTNPYFIAVYQQ
ncbi:MAG: Spi family protease inhibitor [Muribaculaceae bacterium]|nr:Spi family protease inhibitor [Muribaculaceae bacterium]